MANIRDLRIDDPGSRARAPGSRDATWRSGWRIALAAIAAVIVIGAAGLAWVSARGDRDQINTASGLPPASSSAPSEAPRAAGSFTAAGYIEVIPPGARVISSRIAAMVSEIHVQEGQHVSAGDLLATLDTALLEQELRRRGAEIEVLRAQLARLEAGYLPEEIRQAEVRITAAEARLAAAHDQHEQDRQLVESGIAPRRTLLEAEAELAAAAAALAEAQAEYDIRRRGTRPEDIAIAQAELARAEIEFQHTQWMLEQCAIASPADGVVFQQITEPGQWLAPESDRGAAILSIFDPNALQVWVDVTQRDIGRISVGQRVTMIVDGATGTELTGRVSQIMPRASIERNTVRVKIAIESEHDGLRPDMSLRVTFHE